MLLIKLYILLLFYVTNNYRKLFIFLSGNLSISIYKYKYLIKSAYFICMRYSTRFWRIFQWLGRTQLLCSSSQLLYARIRLIKISIGAHTNNAAPTLPPTPSPPARTHKRQLSTTFMTFARARNRLLHKHTISYRIYHYILNWWITLVYVISFYYLER